MEMEAPTTIQEDSSLGIVAGKKMTKKNYKKFMHAWRTASDLCIRIFGLPKRDSKTVYPYCGTDANGHICQKVKKMPIPDFKELV